LIDTSLSLIDKRLSLKLVYGQSAKLRFGKKPVLISFILNVAMPLGAKEVMIHGAKDLIFLE
jgi:hypothetical protein